MTDDPQDYFVLKALKKLSSNPDTMEISSSDLAEEMGVSQQSASNYIIRLAREGLIDRRMSGRRQAIVITPKGLEILYRELNSLNEILENEEAIVVRGRISSGLGEGKYYISRKNYVIQFQQRLGFIPYLGTLNITVDPDYRNHYTRIHTASGIRIEGFKTEDRTFGPVRAFKATFYSSQCAIIMPDRTLHSDVVEVISVDYLRGKYNLKDGDEVSIRVLLKPQN